MGSHTWFGGDQRINIQRTCLAWSSLSASSPGYTASLGLCFRLLFATTGMCFHLVQAALGPLRAAS